MKKKLEPLFDGHAGDCTIYASIINIGMPEAGICTCGYGLALKRHCDYSELFSEELIESLKKKKSL